MGTWSYPYFVEGCHSGRQHGGRWSCCCSSPCCHTRCWGGRGHLGITLPLLTSPPPPGTLPSSFACLVVAVGIPGGGSKPEADFFCHPISLKHQSGCYALSPAACPRHKLGVSTGWREGGRASVVVDRVGWRTASCCVGRWRAKWLLTSHHLPPSCPPSRYLSPSGQGRERGG